MIANINLMIAGSILDIVFNGLMGDSKPSLREGGGENFDSLIKQSLFNTGETNSVLNILTPKRSETGGNGTGVYLKALNDSLAAKGKSLDKTCLKNNDINMLTEFLFQCGYTDADAKQFMGKLLEKHPDGMIPLSEFFSQVGAPGRSVGKQYPSIIMDPSVTPRFDSLLKDFGLTLAETERTLNAARAADGGLDLDKLIAQLKATRDRMKGEKHGADQDAPTEKVLTKLQELGIQIQPGQATSPVKMDDLIKGLEQLKDQVNAGRHGGGFLKDNNLSGADATGRGYNGRLTENIVKTVQNNRAEVKNSASQLPLDVKSSIDLIVEKAVAANGKLELELPVPSILQLKTASSGGEKESTGVMNFSEGNKVAAQVNKNGKSSIKQDNYGGRIIEAGLQEKLERISNLNEESGHKKEMNPGTNRDGLKNKTVEIIQNGGYSSVRFETISSIPRNRQTDNNFFPEHIVDQLEKQISRSVLRGDRIINLQLNPPELGSVKLSMEIKGNTLQLGMIAENSSVKEIMLAGAHELRSALLDQGIKLEGLDIQVGQNFGRSLTNLNEGSGQDRQQYQETNRGLFSDNDIQEDVLPVPRSKSGRVYLLNLEV